ncbi:RluA family pseudouridine synthase [Candidatus Saccharibacteria bacterium]|nr:RluA family pseudouridine synthase [Candidatus Saccharibacteria bacterium]
MIITGKKFSKPAMSRVINGDVVLDGGEEKPEKFRLDHLLVEQYPNYNRSTLQRFIKDGCVTVDGKTVRKSSAEFEKTAKLVLNVSESKSKKSNSSIEVIYEDDHVKAVNKPSGLLSIAKGEYCAEPTLEDHGLLVHRLDRGTSGVVILAKDEETQSMLRRQFQERHAHKVYFAVVKGRPKLDEAKIDLPIARNLSEHSTFRVDPSGKESVTFYKVIKTNDKYSLLELRPVTGRTHQLRVHLKYIGTPIVGDPIYGEAKKDSRLMLHAHSLEITIPGPTKDSSNVRKTFTAPVPPEFNTFFEE